MQVAGDELHEELLRGVRAPALRPPCSAARSHRTCTGSCLRPARHVSMISHTLIGHRPFTSSLQQARYNRLTSHPALKVLLERIGQALHCAATLLAAFRQTKQLNRNFLLFTSTCQEVSRRETKTACMTAEESVLNGGACQAFVHCVWRAQRTQQQDPEQKCH